MQSIFRRYYDYALALGKSEDMELQSRITRMPRITVWQIYSVNASAWTPFDYYLQNMCLLCLDHLIKGLNTRFDTYKMHAFVPSVTGMGESGKKF